MKTAESIAQTQFTDSKEIVKESRRGKHPKSLANLRPWKSGCSGNPGGRKKDKSQEIARKIFEMNPAAVYEAMGNSVLQGNAYSFSVLADRAYGKVKETRENINPNGTNGSPIAALQINFVQVTRDTENSSELPGQVSIPLPTKAL